MSNHKIINYHLLEAFENSFETPIFLVNYQITSIKIQTNLKKKDSVLLKFCNMQTTNTALRE